MTELYIGFALLLGLAAVFLLLPRLFLRHRGVSSVRESNLDWYRQRERELAGEDDPELLEETRLRLLEDGVDQLAEPEAKPGDSRGWLILLALVVSALVLYQQLGAAPDVDLTRRLAQMGEGADEALYPALMADVEVRAAQRPDNLHYQAMLGRFYMNQSDYGRASALYRELVRQAPGDAVALALAAQAAYLAADRQLDADSQMLAERALAVDPHQPTALGLLGMAAYENGQYRAAIEYWQRLVAMQDPASQSAQMIRGVIARAQQALDASADGADGAVATTASAATPTVMSPGVTVSLQLPQGSAAAPGDSVFLFARNPESTSRMPVAVKRLTVADLPVTLRLDDSATMAGQKISDLESVLVVARVSPSGQPGEEYASMQAELGPLAPDTRGDARVLQLKPKKN